MTKILRMPTSPSFWREWLRESPEIHGLQDDGEVADAISDVIIREIRSAEQAAAVVWYMTQSMNREDRKGFACQAAERWLELCSIAAYESGDPRAGQAVATMRAEWAAVEARFDWETAD